jgi:hypothetical protein
MHYIFQQLVLQPPFSGNDCGAGTGLGAFVAEDISAYAVEII